MVSAMHIDISSMVRKKRMTNALNYITSTPHKVLANRKRKWIRLSYLRRYTAGFSKIIEDYGFCPDIKGNSSKHRYQYGDCVLKKVLPKSVLSTICSVRTIEIILPRDGFLTFFSIL